MRWLHKLLNPHCPACALETQCKNCEDMRQLLDQERYDKRKLLDVVLNKLEPQVEQEVKVQLPEELKPKVTTWRMRQQMLEAESRREAEILAKEKMNEIEALEKEVGIS